MKHFRTITLALLMASWAPSALALDEAVISTARELGEKGLAAYDAGRYDAAARLLLQAYRAVNGPHDCAQRCASASQTGQVGGRRRAVCASRALGIQ
jgi:hypothetical protein